MIPQTKQTLFPGQGEKVLGAQVGRRAGGCQGLCLSSEAPLPALLPLPSLCPLVQSPAAPGSGPQLAWAKLTWKTDLFHVRADPLRWSHPGRGTSHELLPPAPGLRGLGKTSWSVPRWVAHALGRGKAQPSITPPTGCSKGKAAGSLLRTIPILKTCSLLRAEQESSVEVGVQVRAFWLLLFRRRQVPGFTACLSQTRAVCTFNSILLFSLAQLRWAINFKRTVAKKPREKQRRTRPGK